MILSVLVVYPHDQVVIGAAQLTVTARHHERVPYSILVAQGERSKFKVQFYWIYIAFVPS